MSTYIKDRLEFLQKIKGKDRIQFNFRIDKNQKEQLDHYAEENNIHSADILRVLIYDYLQDMELNKMPPEKLKKKHFTSKFKEQKNLLGKSIDPQEF